jgi:hypothetical protein
VGSDPGNVPTGDLSLYSDPINFLVYHDTRQGARLAEGAYEEAIAMDSSRNATAFDTFNNRCVLLTITRAFDEATEMCDEAVEEADFVSNSLGGAGFVKMKQKQRSMALTNRGVLKAVTGDSVGARQDFDAVIALAVDTRAASANLMRLSLSGNDLAAADMAQ